MTRRFPPDAGAVLRDVESYFGEDPISGPARARLLEWGEAALPHLEAIARQPHDLRFDHGIVFSITHLATARACVFFVDMLRGATGVRPEHALQALPVLLRRPVSRQYLESDPAFKAALLAFASSASLSDRALVAQAMQTFGWSEGVAPSQPTREDAPPPVRELDPLLRFTGTAPND